MKTKTLLLMAALLFMCSLCAHAATPPIPFCTASYADYVKVSWSSVSGASGYRIRRCTISTYR